MFGKNEEEPEGTPDFELAQAYMAVELDKLPHGRGLNDEEVDFLNLMMLVKGERAKAEAKAAQDAAKRKT